MAIAAERLQEFIRLYEAEFKQPISEEEARETASRLVELYQLLATPLPAGIPEGSGDCSAHHHPPPS